MINRHETRKASVLFVGVEGSVIGKLVPMMPRDCDVLCVDSGAEAAALPARQGPAAGRNIRIVICEQNLPDLPGAVFLENSMALFPRAKRILLIDYTRLDMDALHRVQLFRFIIKPYSLDSLISTIRAALAEIGEEGDTLRCDLEIVGRAPNFLEILEIVKRVGPSDAPVLVRGETGTGKELIARALHCNGPGKDRPYVVINCSALPESLFETEMFGFKKGSFTGAQQDRKGRVALADGGTLFIDELADIPMQIQTKLLRFLQFGEYQPVGSNRIERAGVRIVTATNGDLEKKIKDGTFRKDLYYRLNVLEITIPPLRERRPDIRLLAEAFVKRYWTRPEAPVLTGHALKILGAYDFPGNVRELENVVRRACLTARTEEIDLDALPPEMIKEVMQKSGTTQAELPPEHTMFSRLDKEELKMARIAAAAKAGYRVEEVFLRRLMARFDSVTSAAAHSGMQRTHLHSMLTKHGIHWREEPRPL